MVKDMMIVTIQSVTANREDKELHLSDVGYHCLWAKVSESCDVPLPFVLDGGAALGSIKVTGDFVAGGDKDSERDDADISG
jgi:hypothetical protein